VHQGDQPDGRVGVGDLSEGLLSVSPHVTVRASALEGDIHVAIVVPCNFSLGLVLEGFYLIILEEFLLNDLRFLVFGPAPPELEGVWNVLFFVVDISVLLL